MVCRLVSWDWSASVVSGGLWLVGHLLAIALGVEQLAPVKGCVAVSVVVCEGAEMASGTAKFSSSSAMLSKRSSSSTSQSL